MRNVLKSKRGITLIALILTIIVLVILAGVAIATLTGNNNIIENANKAVGKYNEKANEEQGVLDELKEKLKEYVGERTPVEDYDSTNLKVDENGLATANIRVKPSTDNATNLQIVIPKGFAPAVLKTGTLQSLPGENGEVDHKMPASEWNKITEVDINKGIVLVDADGNEFVWIPITDSSKFARIAWTTNYGYDENGEWIEETLTTSQQLSDTSTANKWWEDTNTSEYTNMIKSVTINKGFYVARYEIGKNSESGNAQSKRNQEVWNYISQTDAITKSTNYNGTLHSHLIYGIEWDSILNWVNENATISSAISGQTKTMELSDIQTNSCSWGNYDKSTGSAVTNIGPKKPSGTNEYWKVNNIYDLAGNEWEWTQEKWSTGPHCAIRGGTYDYNGINYPAAFRLYQDENHTNFCIGYRISLYI